MFFKSRKVISMSIVFVIVFTYMGQTLESIATTDGLSSITNGFFKTSEMEFNSYFVENERQNSEIISDVNEKTTLVLQLSPRDIGKGFLKKGTILASTLDESNINFKFSKIKNVSIDEREEVIYEEDIKPDDQMEEENAADEVIENEEEIESNIDSENSAIENTVEDNTIKDDFTNQIENTTILENIVENTTVKNETIKNETAENITSENNITNTNLTTNEILMTNTETNATHNQTISRSSEPRVLEDDNNSEELVNEEQILEEFESEKEETYEELTAKDFEIEITNDNEITVQNVIYNTTIEVEIEYNQKEKLELADLYKQINLTLRGTYINIDLEKMQTEQQSNIMVGWKYHQEIDITGEYTQFSPFKLGEHTGSIVENKISVKREIEDEKYLPIRQTSIEIDVPDYQGKAPEAVHVQCTKLMATRGEDVGEVNFGEDNWTYNAEDKKITISVQNENDGKAVFSKGEDEYIIVYRYQDYAEDEQITMQNTYRVTMGEYSANNTMMTKEFNDSQTIKTQINDLITYHIGSTEETVSKAKINANFQSEESPYEAEFTTIVNVNILTSDLLEEFKINSSKEVYLDSNSTEFDATADVYYNKVKFNYNEIKNMLQNGATIEIQNLSGELLYVLNNELVTNQDACEVRLESKETGIYVIFKNVSTNGNIAIEYTKAISKSNYNLSAFNNFREIKSYCQAELKYQNYEERYMMDEISVTKKMQASKTVAELKLINNNLNTTAKNDGVELRIVLNNDKLNTDLYKNPSFELVFPKYVKEVAVESSELIYDCGLEIKKIETYKENNIVKMRIDLSGIQTRFSESVITSGTNIILNLNLSLDEYTPRKQDQIKMYYCNEAVTNYGAQTVWTISKLIPNGILKDTNGFDVAVVNYQAPNGLVTSNAIINYDGKASKINSIAEGEKTAEIKKGAKSQIATMELVAMNNTQNICSDVVLLGRIPFKGNTSVITGQELGSTSTVRLLGNIEENVQNPNMTTIYYSTNEKATKDLNDNSNAWTTTVGDWSQVRSYMIVVKGELKEGIVLKFDYDFEIPENLDYDEDLYGSFGGFYNNHSKVAVYYESTEADKVGILTQRSLPIKLKLDVDSGDKEEVKTNQYLNYIVTVTNEGEKEYSGITINANNPIYTHLCEKGEYFDQGNNYYVISNEKELQWTIDTLKPGESREFTYMVKIQSSWFHNMKIKNMVSMNVGSLNGEEVTSNTVENGVSKSDFDILVSSVTGSIMEVGDRIGYRIQYFNMTDSDYGEFSVVLNIPEGLEYAPIEGSDQNGIEFDEITRKLKINKKGLASHYGETSVVYLKVNDVSRGFVTLKPYIITQNGNIEHSTGTTFETAKGNVTISSGTNYDENQIAENQDIEIDYFIKNNGYIKVKDLECMVDLADVLEDPSVYFAIITNDHVEDYEKKIEKRQFSQKLDILPVGDQIQIRITGRVKNTENDQLDVLLSKLNVNANNIESKEKENKVQKIKDIGNNAKDQEEEPEGNYEISGNIWVDENGDGIRIKELENVSAMQVQLLKNGNMIKATTTDSSGNYKFTGLANGTYSVVYSYDKDTYKAEKYSGEEITEVSTSKGYELEEGKAVSDEIIIADGNVTNLDLGMQEKDKFDMSIKETISKAIVNIDGQETEYEYADLDLAKIEIEPNKIDKTTIKFIYKIMVENTGNVDGKVTSIVDYLPAGMIFKESENEGWSNGVNGNIYNDSLRDFIIEPGEVKELSLVLSKKFNEDNTGVLSNKVKIAYTENHLRLTEAIEGNFATQEMIVTVTQGGHTGLKIIITTVGVLSFIAIFAYMVKTGSLEVKFNGKSLIKKVYK